MPASAPIVGTGSWHVNHVLFYFDGGQIQQRCLVLKFMSSIKCLAFYHKCTHKEQGFFWLSQSSRNFNWEKRSTKFIMSSKCFDLSPQVHTQQGAGSSGSSFFPLLTEKASYILLPVSQWRPQAEHELFAPNWFPSSGLALVWSTTVLAVVKSCWRGLVVNLHAPTPFAQIGQGYLRRDLCVGILLHLR